MNKGDFIAEKLNNMREWLAKELPDAPKLPPLQPLQAMMFAEKVAELEPQIRQRDLEALLSLEVDETLLLVLKQLSQKPALHAKFWRYADLCVEIAA